MLIRDGDGGGGGGGRREGERVKARPRTDPEDRGGRGQPSNNGSVKAVSPPLRRN